MILEYQGEINTCKILRYVTWPFVWSYGRPSVPYSVFFQLLAYVQWTRVFSGLTVTFVTKTDTNVLYDIPRSTSLLVSRNVVALWREGQIQVNIADFVGVIAECGL